jgi:hypothetical protein
MTVEERELEAKISLHTIGTSVDKAGKEVSIGFSIVVTPWRYCFGLSNQLPNPDPYQYACKCPKQQPSRLRAASATPPSAA